MLRFFALLPAIALSVPATAANIVTVSVSGIFDRQTYCSFGPFTCVQESSPLPFRFSGLVDLDGISHSDISSQLNIFDNSLVVGTNILFQSKPVMLTVVNPKYSETRTTYSIAYFSNERVPGASNGIYSRYNFMTDRLFAQSFVNDFYHGGIYSIYRGTNYSFRVDGVEVPVFMGRGTPEPSTWAMFVSGFGLVGLAARRRKRTIAA